MPYIEMPLGDIQEAEHVPTGRYDLRVTACTATLSKKAKEAGLDDPDMYNVIVQIEGEVPVSNPAPIFLHLAMPGRIPGEEQRSAQFKGLQIKRFLHWFSVPFEDGGFNDEDIEGATASGMKLTVEPNFEDEDNFHNEISFAPVPTEPPETQTRGRRPRS